MTEDDRTLTHLPFFERLASLDEGGAAFRAHSAGLVVLRLFDAWVTEGPHVAAVDGWGLRAVREAIDAVDTGNTVRALLTSVVDAMDACAPRARAALVFPRLMAYARALQFESELTLASDVYRSVLAHAHPFKDGDVVVSANLQLGAALRTLALWDEAWAAYGDAGEVAALTGDIMNMLKARIGEANVSTDRGNLPEAERILDQTIADAEQMGMREVRALALQDRAAASHRRGDYDAAIAMQYMALRDFRNGVARDRVLADLAGTFFEIGLRSAARDANLVLAATAQEQYTRWTATINLMEIASHERQETAFELYRRELATAALPPVLAAWYHFYVGQGCRMFDRVEQARISLERALEIAQRHQLNQVLFHAEGALAALRDGETPVVAAAVPASALLTEAVDGVRQLRESAGITH
jgi:tetratricopeptide (TPR) repeat protein